MDRKLLTIGIPTHNGSKYIEETIGSILAQAGLSARDVEILISDNASTDSTPEIIDQYAKKHPDLISHHRNHENIGYDRNVDMLFKMAKGDYVQLLGDDDFYKDCLSLNKILQTIKSNIDIGVILLSIDFLDIGTLEVTKGLRVDKDTICSNGDEFFMATKWGCSTVSSLIIKSDLWNKVDVRKYFGSLWIHVGALIEVLRNSKKTYIIAEPLIVVRTNNSRWREHGGNQLECGIKHLRMFEALIPLGYDKETYDLFLKDRYQHNLRDIVFLKPNKLDDKLRVASLMIRYFKKYPLFWILQLPAIFLPKIIYYPILFIKDPGHFSKKLIRKLKGMPA